jgi:hypothetical protein
LIIATLQKLDFGSVNTGMKKGGSPTALIFIFYNLFLCTSYKSYRKPVADTGLPFGAS